MTRRACTENGCEAVVDASDDEEKVEDGGREER